MAMPWGRRIRLYLTGVGLGIVICLILFRGRDLTGCTPTRRITTFLYKAKKLDVDSGTVCRLNCNGITMDDIRAALPAGNVDFGKSEPRKEPEHEYDVTVTVKGKQLELYVATNMTDSTARILRVYPAPDGTKCGCK